MRLTWFPTVLATELQRHDISWETLVYNCQHPQIYPSKANLPLIKLATFGDMQSAKGSFRFDANVQSISGIEGDYDAGLIGIDAACSLLSLVGIKSVFYTSPSHTSNAPRWRVLIPLSREYQPAERKLFVARLNGLLGGILATESFTLSQTYYFGAVVGVEYRCVFTDGVFLDNIEGSPEVYPFKSKTEEYSGVKQNVDIDDLRSALKMIPTDDYQERVSVGQSLFCLGPIGYQLWVEWLNSAGREFKNETHSKWATFTGERTGPQSIFVKADRLGWINPKRGTARDLSGIGFGSESSNLNESRRADLQEIPDLNRKETKALSTVDNLEFILKRYGVQFYYDELLKREYVTVPGNDHSNDLRDTSNYSAIKSLLSLNEIPSETIDRLPQLFARDARNPIRDYICSIPWDSSDRLIDFYNTVHVSPDKIHYRNCVLRMWMIQCVAAMDGAKASPIRNKRFKYESVLVFQSPQGGKKTSWVQSLVPECYREYVLDGVTLETSDKDSRKHAISAWIVELGELDGTFRKSDMARLKSFLSNESDSIRLPYDRVESKFQRRTSYFASVNDSSFLVDDTGNRRFMPLAIEYTEPFHNLEMQQVWAQTWELYLAGEQWWPDEDLVAMLEPHQLKHTQECEIESTINDAFDLSIIDDSQPILSLTMILDIAGRYQPKQRDLNKAANAMKKYNHKLHRTHTLRGYRLTKRPKHPLV